MNHDVACSCLSFNGSVFSSSGVNILLLGGVVWDSGFHIGLFTVFCGMLCLNGELELFLDDLPIGDLDPFLKVTGDRAELDGDLESLCDDVRDV